MEEISAPESVSQLCLLKEMRRRLRHDQKIEDRQYFMHLLKDLHSLQNEIGQEEKARIRRRRKDY